MSFYEILNVVIMVIVGVAIPLALAISSRRAQAARQEREDQAREDREARDRTSARFDALGQQITDVLNVTQRIATDVARLEESQRETRENVITLRRKAEKNAEEIARHGAQIEAQASAAGGRG